MSQKGTVLGALILCLLVVALLVASGLTQWYKVTLAVDIGGVTTKAITTLSLQGQTSEFIIQIGNNDPTVDRVTTEKWQDVTAFPSVKQVYEICAIFILAGFVMYSFISVLLLVNLLKPLRKAVHPCLGGSKGRYFLLFLSFIGTGCICTGALYLLRQPSAFKNDYDDYSYNTLSCGNACSQFMGSQDLFTWGPDIGWWLVIGAAALSVLSFFLIAYKRRKFAYQKI